MRFCPFSLAEIGIGVTGFGMFFLFFGVILFFDKGLLAIGNVSNFQINTINTSKVIKLLVTHNCAVYIHQMVSQM